MIAIQNGRFFTAHLESTPMKPWIVDLEIGADAERQLVPPLGSTLFHAILDLDTFERHRSRGDYYRKSWSHQGHQLTLTCGGNRQTLKVGLHLLGDPEATSVFLARIGQLLQPHGLQCFSDGGRPFVGADRLREVMLEGHRGPLRYALELRESLKRAARSPVAGPADKAYFDGLRRLARGES